MIVVSNTSPLIFLSSIDMLELLNHEFGEVLIPDAVYREFTVYEEMVKPWIKTKKIKEFKSVLDSLIDNGLWIDDALRTKLLED